MWLRPSRSRIPFAGIPVLITGDAFQLPVVKAKCILSKADLIEEYIQWTFRHFTEKVFCLNLSQSVRQDGDSRYAEILQRMRLS